MKVDDENEDSIINKIVSDKRKCLKTETSFETNKEVLGMRNVLRGTTIKSWTGTNFETSEYRNQNKIIIKQSLIFCKEFWVDICKEMHNEE